MKFALGTYIEELILKPVFLERVWNQNQNLELEVEIKVGMVGFWTDSLGSDEWQEKINDVLVNEESEIFEAQVEDLYDFMDPSDANIQVMMAEEIRKFIYVWYDEETETEYEFPVLKEIDLSALGLEEYEEEGDREIWSNEDWDNDFMEITTTSIWRISHHFPSMIDE